MASGAGGGTSGAGGRENAGGAKADERPSPVISVGNGRLTGGRDVGIDADVDTEADTGLRLATPFAGAGASFFNEMLCVTNEMCSVPSAMTCRLSGMSPA